MSSVHAPSTYYLTLTDVHSVEMILDLENMVYELIGRHAWWKRQQEKKQQNYPKRIVFYRDGVSGKSNVDTYVPVPAHYSASQRGSFPMSLNMSSRQLKVGFAVIFFASKFA